MPITALYAALLAPLFLLLSAHTISRRRQEKVAFGDGGDTALLQRIRAHANFAEYVPFVLVLLAAAETSGISILVLHATGLSLVAGRYVHAWGVTRTPHSIRLRVIGMALTFTAISLGALACLFAGLRGLF